MGLGCIRPVKLGSPNRFPNGREALFRCFADQNALAQQQLIYRPVVTPLRHGVSTLNSRCRPQFVDEASSFEASILIFSRFDKRCATVQHKPRLLRENMASYITAQDMSHVRGAPMDPQTQGKIERWHQTLKNHILLKITICPVTSKPRSMRSSNTITISAITRA